MITSTKGQKEKAELSELDEAWDLALADARDRARAAGRTDIAEFIDLRRKNDLLRSTATRWLVDVAMSLAADANRAGGGIQIDRDEAHRFPRGHATMVGSRITFRSGVRALTIESGWPRAPRDGFIRGNALACANIKHLGRPRMNQELILVSSSKGSPQWLIVKDDLKTRLTESHLRRHFSILTES